MGLNCLKFPVVDNSVIHRPVHERNVTVSGVVQAWSRRSTIYYHLGGLRNYHNWVLILIAGVSGELSVPLSPSREYHDSAFEFREDRGMRNAG
jgi:hypothetical protein